MEDAFTTDVDLAEPLEAATVPLPGIELAEALHHDQYPALVRFLLMQCASWAEAQDAFTQMCVPGLSITYPRAWLRTVAWRSWVSQQVKLEESCAEMPEPQALSGGINHGDSLEPRPAYSTDYSRSDERVAPRLQPVRHPGALREGDTCRTPV